MRVVIDTNVLASAIFFGGNPKKLIDYLMIGKIDAYASLEILTEYTETVEYLKEKFSKKTPTIPLMHIEAQFNIIDVKTHVNICRDPDDNKFIDCAIDAECYYIVSGDKDHLSLSKYQNINIVTVSDFINLID